MSEWAWYGYWRAILYLTKPVLLYGLTFNLVSPKCNTYPCQRAPQAPVPSHRTGPATSPQNRLGGLHAPGHRAGHDCRLIPGGKDFTELFRRANPPAGQGNVVAELSCGDLLPLRVPDNQGDVGPLRDLRQPCRNGRHGGGDAQTALARMTELMPPVSTISSTSNPARPSRPRNWSPVRSAPPVITSRFRSSSPPAPEASSSTISTT